MSYTGERYSGPKILIADDDGVSRLFCSQSLALPGVRVRAAESGKTAIRLAASYLPDIVLMDAHLHDMSGVAAIAAMRREWPDSCPAPCFAGMTADDSATVAPALRAAGCLSILIKPFSAQALVACIREACGPGSGFRAFLPAPQDRAAMQQLRAMFHAGLAAQLVELDGAITRLDWDGVQLLVHRLSGAAALAGLGDVAHSGRTLLRRLPPTNPACALADSYLFFLRRLQEVAPP
ncbi:MAG: response regulator [Xanthomonadales bacterium]|nr:response regulator [Xanthomonadales bacterium]